MRASTRWVITDKNFKEAGARTDETDAANKGERMKLLWIQEQNLTESESRNASAARARRVPPD